MHSIQNILSANKRTCEDSGMTLTLKLGSAYVDALFAAERFSAAVVAAACNLATTKSAVRVHAA
jgi:hypothetical protein